MRPTSSAARADVGSPVAIDTTALAAATCASGCGPSQRNRSAACAAPPSCMAMLAEIRTAVARSRASSELSSSSASRPAVAQSPVIARASARRAVSAVAPASAAARYSRAAWPDSTATERRTVGELVGQPGVAHSVLGQSKCEIR